MYRRALERYFDLTLPTLPQNPSVQSAMATNKDDEQKRSNKDDEEDDGLAVILDEPMDTSSDDRVLEKLKPFFAKHKITSEEQLKFLRILEDNLQDPDFQACSIDGKVGMLYGFLIRRANIGLSFEAVREALRSLDLEGSQNRSGHTRTGKSKITDGLDTKLAHSLDLDAFEARLNELFLWHTSDTEYKKFRAPYFPLVQSSGMGKTKIFQEARKRLNGSDDTVCMTILCMDMSLEEDVRKTFFDERWRATSPSAEDTWKEMDYIYEKATQRKPDATRVVFLFDEAQGLMVQADNKGREALVFRAIRWWLRLGRGHIHVVAAFAGTNVKLANFFPKDKPPAKRAQVSRLPKKATKTTTNRNRERRTRRNSISRFTSCTP